MGVSLTKNQLQDAINRNWTKEEVMNDLNITWNQLRYNLDKYKLKLRLPGNIKDERNHKYGKLTVIEYIMQSNDQNEALWKCRCECGNEVIRSGVELRRNRYENMCSDCQKNKVHLLQFKDHTNERHGKLTVLHRTKVDKNTGNIFWLCQCDCGNQIEVISYRLNYNTEQEAQSCGCLESTGEYYLNLILNDKKIKYKTQYQFENCRNSKTNRHYKFDFAIFNNSEQLLFLIEYNGKQHYEKSETGWNTEENVKQTQFRDNEKISYCQLYNIPLLIIPYNIKGKEQIEKELERYIIEHKFNLKA